MVKLNRFLKASTLIETMIAMVLILVCMGVSSMVYVSVISSDNASTRLKANLLLDEIAEKTKSEHTYIDEQISGEGLLIDKSIKPYQGKELILLTLKAKSVNGIMIADHNEIIISD